MGLQKHLSTLYNKMGQLRYNVFPVKWKNNSHNKVNRAQNASLFLSLALWHIHTSPPKTRHLVDRIVVFRQDRVMTIHTQHRWSQVCHVRLLTTLMGEVRWKDRTRGDKNASHPELILRLSVAHTVILITQEGKGTYVSLQPRTHTGKSQFAPDMCSSVHRI